jgi:type IV secretory pathway VirB9-like protein
LVARARGGALRTPECLLYPYGQGKPRLVCAVNRACHIILQDGDTLRDKSLADPRWIAEPMRGPNNTMAVVVKPRFCDVTTSLTFSTQRRFYSVLLDSPPCNGADMDSTHFNPRLPYTDALVFYYPDSGVSSFRPAAPGRDSASADIQRAEPNDRRPGDTERGLTAGVPAGPLHLAYDVRYDRGFPWKPVQVYDNGVATFIYYPDAARRYPFPLVYEVTANGTLVRVDFQNEPQSGHIRVNRIATRLLLVISQEGAQQVRLVIERKGAR